MSANTTDPGLLSLTKLCQNIAKVVPPESVLPRSIEDPTAAILLRSRLKSIGESKEARISRMKYSRRGASCGYDLRNSNPSCCFRSRTKQSHLYNENSTGTYSIDQWPRSEDNALYSSSHFTEDPVEFSEETSRFAQTLTYPGAISNEEEEFSLLSAAISRHRVVRGGVSQKEVKSLPPLGTDRKLILTMDNIERSRVPPGSQKCTRRTFSSFQNNL